MQYTGRIFLYCFDDERVKSLRVLFLLFSGVCQSSSARDQGAPTDFDFGEGSGLEEALDVPARTAPHFGELIDGQIG
jgi:hypothetical protein